MVADRLLSALFDSNRSQRLFKVLVGATFVLGVITSIQAHQKADCQAGYNQATAERISDLADATTSERVASRKADDAMNALVNQLLTSNDKLAVAAKFHDLQIALDEQAVSRAAADQARKEHPPLPLPEDVC